MTAMWAKAHLPEANAKKAHRGPDHPKWRPTGSKRITDHGYVEVKIAEPDVWQYEHRVVAKSDAHQVTHHRNGLKIDNRSENLEPMTRREHAILHARERRMRRAICQ